MDINRNNYEAFFLDYAEGNLTAEQEELVRRFLTFNPDLREELEAFAVINITPENLEFPLKEKMRRFVPGTEDPFTPENFEMFCIAYLEGDLNENQANDFLDYINQDEKAASELERFRSAYFPAERIPFPGKNSLKRKEPGRKIPFRIITSLAAAAAITALVFLGPFEKEDMIEIAVAEDPERTDNLVREEVIEEVPQIEPEIISEEKQVKVNAKPATLNVIKNKSAPVPVSDFVISENEERIRQLSSSQNQRLASLDLSRRPAQEIPVSYDRIQVRPVEPTSIRSSSLSLAELAKYQIQRATDMVEEEDVLLWSIASKGLQELSRVTGSNASLLASKDEDGSISGIQFRSKYFNLTTPIQRRKE